MSFTLWMSSKQPYIILSFLSIKIYFHLWGKSSKSQDLRWVKELWNQMNNAETETQKSLGKKNNLKDNLMNWLLK